MSYFRTRNNLKNDYSGYQEASQNLRERLITACKKYLANERRLGIGQNGYWVGEHKFQHELKMNLGHADIDSVILQGSYDQAFEAIEIYCDVALDTAGYIYHQEIFPDLQRAFSLSGSVYFLNDEGEINLRVEEDTARNIRDSIGILEKSPSAVDTFKEAVGDLFGRKRNPEDVISDIFVAFEDFLKSETEQKNFGEAINYLSKNNVFNRTQAALVEKINAFRSDVYGVAHAGGSSSPDESDGLWFLETVMSQIKLIDRKLRTNKNAGDDKNAKTND